MKILRSVIAAGLLAGGCASVPTAPESGAAVEMPPGGATVPMKDFGGRPVVDLVIGNATYPAILDTGADVTVLTPAAALALSLPAGQQGVDLPELSLGAAKFRGLRAVVLPMPMPPGEGVPMIVLSAQAFPGYLLAFDFPSRTVSLREGALPADGESTYAFTAEDVIPLVPVRVGDVQVRVHLDTGNPGGLVLPTAYQDKVALASPPRLVGRARTPGGEFEIYRAGLTDPVRVGPWPVALPDLSFSDLRPGGGMGPAPGNVGSGALRDMVLTVDARNRRIRLDRP